MPRLSLGLGVQAVRKVKAGGPPPSGIPVASTTNILVTLNEDFYGYNFVNRSYTKYLIYPTAYYYPFLTPGSNLDMVFNGPAYPQWSFSFPDGEGGTNIVALNTSTNGDYIPTAGWTGPGLITLTITAA
jgi:hypothetical protein